MKLIAGDKIEFEKQPAHNRTKRKSVEFSDVDCKRKIQRSVAKVQLV